MAETAASDLLDESELSFYPATAGMIQPRVAHEHLPDMDP